MRMDTESAPSLDRRTVTIPTEPQFARWVEPSVPAMWRLISRMGGGLEREEILQDALLRAWQKRDQFDPSRGSATAWLVAIAHDQTRQARRRQAGRPATVGIDAADDWPVYDRTPNPDLERAIAILPMRQRTAVECVYLVGLTVEEAAVVMDCRPGTVKSALSDARANLRRRLMEDPR